MTRELRNVAASVRQRLHNLAKERGRPFQEVLQYFAIERFLYRLSQTALRERFLLKGALLLSAWKAPETRSTMDIDLLGHGEDPAANLEAIVRELCLHQVDPPDGMVFDPESVAREEITVESEYVGVRVTFRAHLGTARIPMQIDLGIGDAVIDPETEVELPTLLDFPPARLRGYSRESAIAEKLHAMFVHGRLNSRMKDYFDILLLSRHFAFDGRSLAQAIQATFRRRDTELQADPIGLSLEFARQPEKPTQWKAFLRKINAASTSPRLEDALTAAQDFLLPVLDGLVRNGEFHGQWPSGGPWTA